MDTHHATGLAPVSDAESSSFRFLLTADADPGLLPRVLQVFAKRSLVPGTLHADRLSADLLSVDLNVPAMPAARAMHIAACLRETVGVRTVHGPARVTAG